MSSREKAKQSETECPRREDEAKELGARARRENSASCEAERGPKKILEDLTRAGRGGGWEMRISEPA